MIRSVLISSLLTLVIVIGGSGCATGRLADLRDCGHMSCGVGVGLSADLKVGDLTHPALGLVSHTHRIGFERRDLYGIWTESEAPTPLIWATGLFAKINPFELSYGRVESARTTDFWLPGHHSYIPEANELKRSRFNSVTDMNGT